MQKLKAVPIQSTEPSSLRLSYIAQPRVPEPVIVTLLTEYGP